MDLRCPKCGEPWDLDCIHEEVEVQYPDQPWKAVDGHHDQTKYETYFNVVLADFYRRGCEVFGSTHGEETASPVIGALYELLGDDVDGAASMLEDATNMGYLDD